MTIYLKDYIDVIYNDIMLYYEREPNVMSIVYVSKELYNAFSDTVEHSILNDCNIFLEIDENRHGLDYDFYLKSEINNVKDFFEQ